MGAFGETSGQEYSKVDVEEVPSKPEATVANFVICKLLPVIKSIVMFFHVVELLDAGVHDALHA
jgi:hypothetical protein